MHKNRIIIILGILILLLPELGFTPSTKKFLIQFFAAVVIVLAFLIERKGVFSIWWQKKDNITSVARTYVEHNGTVSTPAPNSTSSTATTADIEEIQ